MIDSIAILDFGSQYTQLIARRIREMRVYCEIFPWDAPAGKVTALQPKGFILSGGPSSVYDTGAPTIAPYLFAAGVPLLGICYGMQALTFALGGKVVPRLREYGLAGIGVTRKTRCCFLAANVRMSHGIASKTCLKAFERSPKVQTVHCRDVDPGAVTTPCSSTRSTHTQHGQQIRELRARIAAAIPNGPRRASSNAPFVQFRTRSAIDP